MITQGYMFSTKIDYRQVILDVVKNKNCVKHVDLALDVMSRIGPGIFKPHEYETVIEKLIDEGELKKIEFATERMNYRIKTLYFPKTTTFFNYQ